MGRVITIRVREQDNHQERVEAVSTVGNQDTSHVTAPNPKLKLELAIAVERLDTCHHSVESQREKLLRMKTKEKLSGEPVQSMRSKMWT